MSGREAVPVVILVVSLIFSASATFVLGRFGTKALWATALFQACLALAFMGAIGWAQTSESPLFISVVMVAVAAAAIASVVRSVGGERPLLATSLAAIAGLVGAYLGIFGGYVLYVYTA